MPVNRRYAVFDQVICITTCVGLHQKVCDSKIAQGPLKVSWVFCLFLEAYKITKEMSDLDLYGTKMFIQYLFYTKK